LHDAEIIISQPFWQMMLASLGGFIAIVAIAWLAGQTHSILMLGSFGASCVLMFGFPDPRCRSREM